MNETIPLNRRQSVYITLYLYYLLYVTLQIMEEEIRITKNRWTSGDSLGRCFIEQEAPTSMLVIA